MNKEFDKIEVSSAKLINKITGDEIEIDIDYLSNKGITEVSLEDFCRLTPEFQTISDLHDKMIEGGDL